MTATESHHPGVPLLGALPALQRDTLGTLARATWSGADVVHMPLPALHGYVLAAPQLVEHVLVGNSRNFVKQTRGYAMLRLVLGNGLVTSEGDFWKRQRRIAQPAFHRERIAGFGDTFVRAASEMVDRWPLGQPFDIAAEFMRVTLRLVGETLLSSDVTTEASGLGPVITTCLEQVIHRTLHPFSAPEWLPTPRNLRFGQAMRKLDGVVLSMIAARRSQPTAFNDVLAMLIAAKDPETGEGMSDLQLRDEVMTMFLAGHETTANALAWTVRLLTQHPEVERRVVAELDQVLQGRTPTTADLPKLTYLAMVLKESMRLYPPVWLLARHVVDDEVVEGVKLQRGARILICTYALHRHPRWWPDADEFKPERWAPDAPTPAKGAYIPFSTGQRKCIGDTFATVEAVLVLATVLQQVRLSAASTAPVEPEALVTLRPKGGLPVVAERRS